MYRHNAKVIDLFQAHEKPTTQPSPEIEAAFSELWKLWPRKEGKVLAKARFLSIVKGCSTRTLEKDSGSYIQIELHAAPEAILAAAKAYLASQVDKNTYRMKDDGKFIPHLNTWLNKGKFYDWE